MLTLNVKERKERGKAVKALRESGLIPGVFYGRKEKSLPISIKFGDFLRVWKEAGESSVISLEGIGEEKEALIQEVSVDAVTEIPLHVDFYVIEKGKKIEVGVPLEFVGESPAVKDLGGSLVKVMHELEVEVLPKDLPHDIKVDISSLVDFEAHITVADLKLPAEVTPLAEPEDTVALVSEPVEEEEEEEVPVEFDESMVEVEKKGKEDEEGAEGGEGEPGKEAPSKEAKEKE